MEHSFGFSNVNKPVVFKTGVEIKTHRNLKDVLLKIVKNSPKPGSAVGGKRQKTGSNRKNIGERSETSGSLGRGKGRGAWRHAFDVAVP